MTTLTIYLTVSIATFIPVVLKGRMSPSQEKPAAVYSQGVISTTSLYILFLVAWVYGLRAIALSIDDISLLMEIGIGIFCVGATIRIAALFVLGPWYAGNIVFRSGQPLVRWGVYALVRHPLHLGLLLELIGIATLRPAVISITALALSFVCIMWRNYAEDRSLENFFGTEAVEYQKKVPAMNIFLGLIRYLNSRATEQHFTDKESS
jgi:protein-S-isoprenylcysteine O-methyltransferase Ste14